MRNPDQELTVDPLFVGATRPPMRWGVTYTALLFNLVLTMEVFLCSKNLLTLLCCVPAHGLFVLLCSRDPRFFDLVLLWARTRLPAAFGNLRVWKASSYSPLAIDIPSRHRFRRQRIATPEVGRPRKSVAAMHGP
jgi:type IV secretion system protein VirB3